MNKRMFAIAGAGMTAAASLALAAPAGASTSHAATPAATHFATISAAPTAPTGAPGNGHCGYPVNNAILVMGPAAQSAPAGGTFSFNGTYGCNGHGLPNHSVYLSASFPATGHCTHTKAGGTGGSFSCSLPATGTGTVTGYTQHAESQPLSVRTK